MARQFNGSSQALDTTNLDLTALGTGPLTIAFWLWWDTFGTGDNLALEHSANYFTNAGTFIVDPNDAGGKFVFAHGKGDGATVRKVSFTRPSAAAWHHYMLVLSTTTTASFVAYVDGSSVTLTSEQNDGGTSWSNNDLFVMTRGATTLWGAGRMAGLGFWNGALTSGNATSLSGGAPPNTIGSPLYAWNICGVASPETASAGALSLTLVGSPPQVADPSAFTVCGGGAGITECQLERFTRGVGRGMHRGGLGTGPFMRKVA